MLKNKWILLLSSVLMFLACDKTSPTPLPEEVKTTILSPNDGTIFDKGDTINIKVDASVENWELHGYELYLYDTVSTDVLFSAAAHWHDGQARIDTFYVNEVTSHINARLEIRFFIDHLGNYKSEQRNLRLLPI